MRILSKNHDYYDGAGCYSAEPVWYRKEEEIILSSTTPTDRLSYEQVQFLNDLYATKPAISSDRCENYLVGLCGKIFPIFVLMYGKYTDHHWGSPGWVNGCYHDRHSAHLTTESYDEKCIKVMTKKENEKRLASRKEEESDRKKYKYSYLRRKNSAYREGVMEEFQNKLVQSKVDQLFIDLGSPLFMVRSHVFGDVNNNHNENVLVVNPVITDFKMQNAIDPWTMYQQLEMYLANELVMCKVPPFNTTDELKRDAHGFDKVSFKNIKGHKRGKS